MDDKRLIIRHVTDSESDGIQHYFQNPLDTQNPIRIFVLVQLYNIFLNNK